MSLHKLLHRYHGARLHELQVSQGGVFRRPSLIHTILGSCVSVTFFHPASAYGGVFHAFLPEAARYEATNLVCQPYRYVDTAIGMICRRFIGFGVPLDEVECKVFGGASALFAETSSMGPQNVEVALTVLNARQLRVSATHVGGARGRKLVFVTHTGEVYVKTLQREQCSLPGPGGGVGGPPRALTGNRRSR